MNTQFKKIFRGYFFGIPVYSESNISENIENSDTTVVTDHEEAK